MVAGQRAEGGGVGEEAGNVAKFADNRVVDYGVEIVEVEAIAEGIRICNRNGCQYCEEKNALGGSQSVNPELVYFQCIFGGFVSSGSRSKGEDRVSIERRTCGEKLLFGLLRNEKGGGCMNATPARYCSLEQLRRGS